MSPVSLNMYLLTVSNHMDAVIVGCNLNPASPNILQSYEVTFFTLNYIIIRAVKRLKFLI